MKFLIMPSAPDLSDVRCSATVIFSQSHSVHIPRFVRDEVSRPYRTAGKIMVLCIFIIIIFYIADEKIEGSGLNGNKNYQSSISSSFPPESIVGVIDITNYLNIHVLSDLPAPVH
jgi:hypothetical protein